MTYIKPELISQIIDLQLTNSTHLRLEENKRKWLLGLIFFVPDQNCSKNVLLIRVKFNIPENYSIYSFQKKKKKFVHATQAMSFPQ